MGNFQDYVQEEYEITLSVGWYSILAFFTDSEEAGLNLFWKVWDEYLIEHTNNPTRFEQGWWERMDRIMDHHKFTELET